MKTGHEVQKPADTYSNENKRRFKIEKLEERIAPKKGGISGNDGTHGPDHRQGCRFGARPGDC